MQLKNNGFDLLSLGECFTSPMIFIEKYMTSEITIKQHLNVFYLKKIYIIRF